MKKTLLLVLLFLSTSSVIALIASLRSDPRRDIFRVGPVDVDFTTFSDTMRAVKFAEIMADPRSVGGKTVRVEGIAYDRVDRDGSRHAWLRVYDGGGCCPLLTVEYLQKGSGFPPQDGTRIVLEGRCVLRDPPVFPIVIVSNATVRICEPITPLF